MHQKLNFILHFLTFTNFKLLNGVKMIQKSLITHQFFDTLCIKNSNGYFNEIDI